MADRDTFIGSLLGLGLALSAQRAAAGPVLPSGGAALSGAVVISSPTAGALTVRQSTAKAIIDWSSFSIGTGGAVVFDNGSGATLNRVIGQNVSAIDGRLSATGSVYLINPNGVIVGKSGVVDTGGRFVASSLDISDPSFLSGGTLTFSGSSPAEVLNYGKIGSLGGDVALIAARVANQGEINAPSGTVGLAAGYQVVLLDRALDQGEFSVAVGGPGTSATNASAISAADVELRANGGNVYALAGNSTGVITATAVVSGQGKVFLVAEGGALNVQGLVQARGLDGAGGQIETSGITVQFAGADIDAGPGGAWLLDPANLTITQSMANVLEASLNDGTSLTEQTSVVGSGGAGDITLAKNVSIAWTTGASLTLFAYRDIHLDQGSLIESSGGGGVTLYADNSGRGSGTVSFAPSALVSTQGPVAIFYDPSSNPAGSKVNPNSYKTPTNYAGDVKGPLTAYMLVNSLADLQNLNNNLSGTYALGRNIDAAVTQTWNHGAGFTPIGSFPSPFTGTLEGQGYSIQNLTINQPNGQFVGLFSTTRAATLSDLNLVGGSVSGYYVVGGLVGYANGGSITASTTSETVNGRAGAWDVGGLVGYDLGDVISLSAASGPVSGGVGAQNLGGLVGASLYGVITGSSATGTVSGASGAFNVGGLLGDAVSTQISQSYARGAVSGEDVVGGLVGLNTSTISQSFALGTVTGGSSLGGLVGDNSGTITGSLALGAVTATANAALSYGVGGLVGANSGSISQSVASGVVTGATVLGSGDVGGLVGDNTGGTITTSSATGAVSSGGVHFNYGVGGLVGASSGGSISQSYATGAVSGSVDVGGLVGDLENTVLTQSFATGSVVGLAPGDIGGLVGAAQGGSISEAYASGSVTAKAVANLGGLVGAAIDTTVNQAYATGAVSGVGANVGGLIGLLYTSTVAQTYASGAVSSASQAGVGGLIGETVGGQVASSYWDVQTTLQPTSAGGTPLTTPQFFSTSNLAGFSFGSAPGGSGWVIVDADGTLNNANSAPGGTRPLLLSEYSTSISNAHQLQLIALNLSASYTLIATIDASATNAAPSSVFSAAGFIPIGATDLTGAILSSFTGTLNGENHTINGLTVDRPNYAFDGLFSTTKAATLENIILTGGSVVGTSGVGDLAGLMFGGTALNDHASGAISGSNASIGGLIGNAQDGTVISQSSASGAVYGSAFVGGLLGYEVGDTLFEDHATGAVGSGGGSNLGGLVGQAIGGSIGESSATGAVNGGSHSSYLGGLIGASLNAAIDQSFASGAVTGGFYLGGLAGYSSGQISNAYATGSVAGAQASVGGLVGSNIGSILFSYSTGAVSGGGLLGGLVGSSSGGTIGASYWDVQTSGQTSSAGGTAETTAALTAGLPIGFSPTLWGQLPGGFPYLLQSYPY